MIPRHGTSVLGDAPAPWSMRAVAALVARVPWGWLAPLGAAIGFLAGSALRIRRAHVEAAMRRAGVVDPRRRARAMYASLGAGLLELLWLAGRPASALDGKWRLAPGAEERLAAAMSGGKGLVLATAHVGNWDLAACATARLLGGLLVVTKRLSWRALDDFWQRLRAERGVSLVPPEGATRAVLRALRSGGAVALLVDQAPERAAGVVTLPFLGAPALHDLAPATLAARAGAPIAVAIGRRTPDGQHELDVVDVFTPSRAEIPAATARVAAAVDAIVRRHPDQWLWMHRRWKTSAARRRVDVAEHRVDPRAGHAAQARG